MGTPRQDNHSSSVVKPVTKPYGRIVLNLKNCLLPEDKLSPTPSQNDGLDLETETDLRILGCELIQTAGILLKLPQVAMATGQVLFQRFYYSKSFVRHAMETTAMGCVCLASKIEEAPRRIRDVINVFHHIKQVKSQNHCGHRLMQYGGNHYFELVSFMMTQNVNATEGCIHLAQYSEEHVVAKLVEELCYKLEGRKFQPRQVVS
ncbi:Cyclin-L1 [Cryptotermes secundus]|uniref:Cyclin-L1 n=1 Tax=Cryptotermes secundus TaxID=105785 RepID=A0A2J7RF45_9NEOP|nr:Cyclin-L1 [Cryptotermes secundus]